MTSTIKLYKLLQLDARVFHDAAHRKRVTLLRFGVGRLPKSPAVKLRNACTRMSLECESLWRFFDLYSLQPVSTQDSVAYGSCGTRIDVLVRDVSDPAAPRLVVIEVKRGHATNWTNGKRTPAPFQARLQSTYDHCLLQASASSAMYAHTNPQAGVLGPPMLVVCDGPDLRAYAPPAWIQSAGGAILRAVGHNK